MWEYLPPMRVSQALPLARGASTYISLSYPYLVALRLSFKLEPGFSLSYRPQGTGPEIILAQQRREKRERGGQRPVPEHKNGRREKGGGKGQFFIMECSKCAQGVLLVATAKDVSCQDPKGRPVQMPEY